jgi:putative Mn2+ efflux pump MntP
MNLGELLLLAVGLAMDAVAVSATRGLRVGSVRLVHLASVALFFGGAQALMPLGGFLLGQQVGPLIAAVHHWVAGGLLLFLGARMVRASSTQDRDHEDAAATTDPFALGTMTALAVATSIDAFAVGVVLPTLGASLWVSVAVIGIVTAVLAMAGLIVGARLGAHLGTRLELVGGVVLIALGLRFVLEQLLETAR